MIEEEDLKKLFAARAISRGKFTLASGKISSYYIDSKRAIFNAEIIGMLGNALYWATQDLHLQAIGGLEVGAIPMATAAATGYFLRGQSIEGFFVRKQAKDHGAGNLIEGLVNPGDHVCIVDDVLTTGGSALRACQEVEKAGAIVDRVVCIVDRLQGARATLGKYDFKPLFTVKDFGIEPEG